jgi:hypothetical protein
VVILWKIKFLRIFDLDLTVNRVLISFIGAFLILLSVHFVFWRNLINRRFLLILFPFLLFVLYVNCTKKTLSVLSVLFIVSGLLYMASNRVSDYYPAPAFDKTMPIIYQDEFSYSTQYLISGNQSSEEPLIWDFSEFERNCKLCKMGRSEIHLENYDKIRIVGREDFNPDKIMPANFILVKKQECLSWFDRLQFKYLSPLHPMRHTIYEYHKRDGRSRVK